MNNIYGQTPLVNPLTREEKIETYRALKKSRLGPKKRVSNNPGSSKEVNELDLPIDVDKVRGSTRNIVEVFLAFYP